MFFSAQLSPLVLPPSKAPSILQKPGHTETQPVYPRTLHKTKKDNAKSVHTDIQPLYPQSRNLGTQKPINAHRHSTSVHTEIEPLRHTEIEPYRNPDEVRYAVWLPKELMRQIKDFCGRNGISVKEYIVAVCTQHLEGPGTQTLNLPCAQLGVHDDDMLHDDKIEIIMGLCTQYAGIQPTARDRREAMQFKDVDPRLIEIAIIQTVQRKLLGNTSKTPIKTFSYFKDEITLIAEQKRSGELPAAFDDYHRYAVTTWKKKIRSLRDEKWGKQN